MSRQKFAVVVAVAVVASVVVVVETVDATCDGPAKARRLKIQS